jgi:hypothetical protein
MLDVEVNDPEYTKQVFQSADLEVISVARVCGVNLLGPLPHSPIYQKYRKHIAMAQGTVDTRSIKAYKSGVQH